MKADQYTAPGTTRKMKRPKRVPANPAAEDSDAGDEDEENPRKKTTIVRSSPPETMDRVSVRERLGTTTSSQASTSGRDTDSSTVGELRNRIEELTRELENKQILGTSNTEMISVTWSLASVLQNRRRKRVRKFQ